MTRKRKPRQVDLDAFEKALPYRRNRMLFEWLSDDEQRGALLDAVNGERGGPGVLPFPSWARDAQPPTHVPHPPDTRPRNAYLITKREHIEYVLNTPSKFSNSPYAALGTGSFMLAVDPDESDPRGAAERRELQLVAARQVFHVQSEQVNKLCEQAFCAALPIGLSADEFDLALLAEEAALHFCVALFGFAAADHPLLENALRKGYRALNHQILGQHFVTDPSVLPEANRDMSALLIRAAALIDEYQFDETQWPDGVECQSRFNPVLRALALFTSDLTGEERAVLAVGALVGIVGNVQASVCIALQALLGHGKAEPGRDLVVEARDMTVKDPSGHSLWPWLAEGLRLNPPVAFVARRARCDMKLGGVDIQADADCILALGGALRGARKAVYPPAPAVGDSLIFGHGVHECLGKHLAEPLVRRICAGVLRLPSLAEQLDAQDGEPIGLEKQWGFRCVSYRLRHRRDLRVVQQPLNVVMKIKSPTAVHAYALARIIRAGAPRIEALLLGSGKVHFAWFEFIDNDTRLVLHTVFNGEFGAYLQYFALNAGDLLDGIFEHIDDAPPRPVSKFPVEFSNTIRRFNQPAAEGFFFSAYPAIDAAQITRADRSGL